MGLMRLAAEDFALNGVNVNCFNRALRAADVCWQVDNLCVAMPIFDTEDARMLLGILQSIGLTVFNGVDHIPCEDYDYFLALKQSVVMVFHARDWQSAAALEKSHAIREMFPNATICVVTGVVSLPDISFYPNQKIYGDARALLQAAGIVFFSTEGKSYELL